MYSDHLAFRGVFAAKLALQLRRRSAWGTGLLLACFAAPASPATIIGAGYDAKRDELIVDIAYRGTTTGHPFVLQSGQCRTSPDDGTLTTVARLIDTRGGEIARSEYRVRQRFDLSTLECRPAQLTLRLGPVSNVTVPVPAARDEAS